MRAPASDKMRSPRLSLACLFVVVFATGACHRSDDVAESPIHNNIATLQYWTSERMAAAGPLEFGKRRHGDPRIDIITPGGDEHGQAPVPVPYDTGLISRITGKLFIYDDVNKRDAYCSASVVVSESRRLLVAAAHCLALPQVDPLDPSKLVLSWVRYPMFVPAHDGTRPVSDEQYAPFGRWAVRRGYVPQTVEDNPAVLFGAQWDLAVASTFDQLGRPIQLVLGGGFSPQLTTADDLFPLVNLVNYPGGGTYDGFRQHWCASRTENLPNGTGIRLPNCLNFFGSSGAPVIVNDLTVPELSGSEVVAVVHSSTAYTRLWADVYPALARAADSDPATSEVDFECSRDLRLHAWKRLLCALVRLEKLSFNGVRIASAMGCSWLER